MDSLEPMDRGRANIDLDHLFRLRLVVARHGEMDQAGWWNTQGLLGPTGAAALRRGFRRTHWFAQARLVFAVATARCQEVFAVPDDACTLWSLPAELEDAFEHQWQEWQRGREEWEPLFTKIAEQDEESLLDELRSVVGLPDGVDGDRHDRAPEAGRSLELAEAGELDNHVLFDLAAGFGAAGPRDLVVPFARLTS